MDSAFAPPAKQTREMKPEGVGEKESANFDNLFPFTGNQLRGYQSVNPEFYSEKKQIHNIRW